MKPSDTPAAPLSSEPPPECIQAGAEYLAACVREGRTFATLIDERPGIATGAVKAFLESAAGGGLRAVRVPAPTDSVHAFLEAVLVELGLDPFESSVEDLKQLLRVVFRHATIASGRCVVILEQAQEFGPHVFEAMRDLARPVAGMEGTALFVLTGPVALGRILDSRGMACVAHLTRERFVGSTLAKSPLPSPRSSPAAIRGEPATGPSLAITQDDKLIGETVRIGSRVLIGRTSHNDVVLPSRYVSRHHAMIINGADGAVLMDLKSTNGTYVNSRAVRSRALRDGDWINIGNYRLRFTDGRPQPLTPAAPGDDNLGETVIMRSLGESEETPVSTPESGNASSA